ncbi:hypothetical protein NO1_0595 [Candidatus Termititenax aidoneus]|uniref:Uncharacterized protein n=1 Tax=Termititenax aidoneus TaxID=2218524 RepID=A0A388TBQ3_TERA1|nr:hypothetical protein NO1_0595 [Candidatus Termititenax aidoneus]
MCAKKFTEPNFNNYNLAQAMVENNKATFIGRSHITAWVDSDTGVMKAGSQIECGGSLYYLDADETPAETSFKYIYIVPAIDSAYFIFSDAVPAYNATKGALYDGNNRAVASFTSDGWAIIGENFGSSESGSGGGSGLDQSLQNIVNEQNGMSAVPQTTGMHDSFMADENVVFNLNSNYSQGATTISLSIVQPENIGEFRQKYAYPFRTQIYDGTNKSYMVLTADSGEADSATTVTFTLAAPLVNLNGAQVAYTTSGTVSKLKMLITGSGTGTIPSDLTGQAAALPENLNVKYLPNTQVNKSMQAAIQLNPTKQYKIISVPNNLQIVLQSDTNDAAMFPLNDTTGQPTEILAYSLISNAFKKFTLSAPAAYSSPNLTLSVNESTAGLNTSAWYAIKSPILSARVEDISQAGALERVNIDKVLLSFIKREFLDKFDATIKNQWTYWTTYAYSGVSVAHGADNDGFYFGVYQNSGGSRNGEMVLALIPESESLCIIRIEVKANPNNMSCGVGFSTTYTANTGTTPFNGVALVISGSNFSIYNNGASVTSGNSGATTGIYRFTVGKDYIGAVRYNDPNSEPPIYRDTISVNQKPILKGNLCGFSMNVYTGQGSTTYGRVRSFSITTQTASNNIIYSLPAQTGNKITTAIAFPIADSASESPSLSGIASYLG